MGLEIKEDDKGIEMLRPLAQSMKSKLIDELLSDLRKDILNVAVRIGKKTLKEIESYFEELDIKRRQHADNVASDIVQFIPKTSSTLGTSKSSPSKG